MVSLLWAGAQSLLPLLYLQQLRAEKIVVENSPNVLETRRLISEKNYDIIVLAPPLKPSFLLSSRNLLKKGRTIMVYLPGCTLEQQLDFYRQGASEVFDALPDVRLLAAKCKALYRVRVFEQNREHQELVMKQGPLCLYPQGRKVTLEGKELSLTPKEYDLLLYMLQNQNQVLSREQIVEALWGYSFEGGVRTVDTHMKSLRKKLKEHASMLQTVWGIGYQLKGE